MEGGLPFPHIVIGLGDQVIAPMAILCLRRKKQGLLLLFLPRLHRHLEECPVLLRNAAEGALPLKQH